MFGRASRRVIPTENRFVVRLLWSMEATDALSLTSSIERGAQLVETHSRVKNWCSGRSPEDQLVLQIPMVKRRVNDVARQLGISPSTVRQRLAMLLAGAACELSELRS